MKRYVGADFILNAREDALHINTNRVDGNEGENFSWSELEKDGICCRPSGICEWTYNSFDDMYDTKCGEGFFFETGNIEENNMRFCPFCGNRIKAIYEEDMEEIEDE